MVIKHKLFNTFDAAYVDEGVGPWDIDHPQQAFVELVQAGRIQGTVLDAGCGTGEHALYIAQHGYVVQGIDIASLAIKKAQEKAQERGIAAQFRVFDALALHTLGETFDTVIDSGLLHNFSDEEREQFIKGLTSIMKPGGTYFVLCFSVTLPHGFGPRGITQTDLQALFREGWHINSIEASSFELNGTEYRPSAWLAAITYISEQRGAHEA